MISQTELHSFLHYDQMTGCFARLSKCAYLREKVGCVCPRGYLRIRTPKGRFLAHRLAWLYVHGVMPECVDHINGIKGDNRLCNLRLAVPGENRVNSKVPTTNTSGFKGVSRHGSSWRAAATWQGKSYRLGCFKKIEDAAAAYAEFARAHHLEFFNECGLVR